MSDIELHKPLSVEDYRESESAIVYLPLNAQIAIKRLKAYKDSRFNMRTPAQRRSCQLEALQWNRKFAHNTYKGLALLCNKHSSNLEQKPSSICIGPLLKNPKKGQLLLRRDYVLVMKRLPEAWRLENHLENNESKIELLYDDIFRLTEHIAYLFHKVLKPLSGRESARWGNIKQIRRKLRNNLELLQLALQERQMNSEPHDRLKDELQKLLQSERFFQIFQKRLEAGFIRRCHGDLKVSNIWIAPPDERADKPAWKSIWLLDAIDFNDSFCYIDVLSDFALFIVDIQARTGSKALSEKLIKSYLSHTEQENETARTALAYYLIEKALVSAALSFKFNDDVKLGKEFLNIAETYLRQLQFTLELQLLSGSFL